jgi:hypothetical protein
MTDPSYRIQHKASDEQGWIDVRPSHSDEPYCFETEAFAESARRLCYGNDHAHSRVVQIMGGIVRVVEPRNRNMVLLHDFVDYCRRHPTDRFWQALRNWSAHPFILASKFPPDDPQWDGGRCVRDTFYWETKDG